MTRWSRLVSLSLSLSLSLRMLVAEHSSNVLTKTTEDWRVIEMFSSAEGDRFSSWSSSSRQTSFRSLSVSRWWAGRTSVKGIHLDSNLLFLTKDERWTDRTRGMNPWQRWSAPALERSRSFSEWSWSWAGCSMTGVEAGAGVGWRNFSWSWSWAGAGTYLPAPIFRRNLAFLSKFDTCQLHFFDRARKKNHDSSGIRIWGAGRLFILVIHRVGSLYERSHHIIFDLLCRLQRLSISGCEKLVKWSSKIVTEPDENQRTRSWSGAGDVSSKCKE